MSLSGTPAYDISTFCVELSSVQLCDVFFSQLVWIDDRYRVASRGVVWNTATLSHYEDSKTSRRWNDALIPAGTAWTGRPSTCSLARLRRLPAHLLRTGCQSLVRRWRIDQRADQDPQTTISGQSLRHSLRTSGVYNQKLKSLQFMGTTASNSGTILQCIQRVVPKTLYLDRWANSIIGQKLSVYLY